MSRKFEITVKGKSYDIAVERAAGGQALVKVNGEPIEVTYKETTETKSPAVSSPAAPPVSPVPQAPRKPAVAAPAAPGAITAPMSGLILEVMVKAGDQVKAGQIVIKLEAMKMENEIPAPADGTVKEIHVVKGAHVEEGQALLVIE